jgi:sugar/nucleoside kinase (ribokinase family)
MIELAARAGVAVSLDTALHPAMAAPDMVRALLPRLAVCVLGRREAQALTGRAAPPDAARALLEAGVEQVGLKLGAEGCLLADPSGRYRLPAYVVNVVDTTGAGDAFSAGLLFGRLRGLSPGATAALANALGALAASVPGAGLALPGLSDAQRLLTRALPGLGDEHRAWAAEALRALPD